MWNSITIEFDQPVGGGALFSLTRTNTVTGETEVLQDFDVSDADIVDDVGIEPDTNWRCKSERGGSMGMMIALAGFFFDGSEI